MMNLIYTPGMTLEDVERAWILQAIRYHRGNKTQAAASLGISVRNIDQKLLKYNEDTKALKKRMDDERRKQDAFVNRSRGQDPDQLQRLAAHKKETAERRIQADAAKHMEPSDEVSEEQSVPVPVGKEVQGLSPQPASGSDTKGRGSRVRGGNENAESRVLNTGKPGKAGNENR